MTAALISVFLISCSSVKDAYQEEKIVDKKSFDAKYKPIEEDKRNFTLLQLILTEEDKNNIDSTYLNEKKICSA